MTLILVNTGKFKDNLKIIQSEKMVLPSGIYNSFSILSHSMNLDEWVSLASSMEPTWPLGSRQILGQYTQENTSSR